MTIEELERRVKFLEDILDAFFIQMGPAASPKMYTYLDYKTKFNMETNNARPGKDEPAPANRS